MYVADTSLAMIDVGHALKLSIPYPNLSYALS